MSDFGWSGKRVIVTGGAGFLGTVICEKLRARGVRENDLFVPLYEEFDLTGEEACSRMYDTAFGGAPTDVIIHLAAEVGGIGANQKNPGRYFYANMAMALHLIEPERDDTTMFTHSPMNFAARREILEDAYRRTTLALRNPQHPLRAALEAAGRQVRQSQGDAG